MDTGAWSYRCSEGSIIVFVAEKERNRCCSRHSKRFSIFVGSCVFGNMVSSEEALAQMKLGSDRPYVRCDVESWCAALLSQCLGGISFVFSARNDGYEEGECSTNFGLYSLLTELMLTRTNASCSSAGILFYGGLLVNAYFA